MQACERQYSFKRAVVAGSSQDVQRRRAFSPCYLVAANFRTNCRFEVMKEETIQKKEEVSLAQIEEQMWGSKRGWGTHGCLDGQMGCWRAVWLGGEDGPLTA